MHFALYKRTLQQFIGIINHFPPASILGTGNKQYTNDGLMNRAHVYTYLFFINKQL